MSACPGVTSSVTVAASCSEGEGVADGFSREVPTESTRIARKIVTALGGGPWDFAGGMAITSTRSPGWIRPETSFTRSTGMLTARMPGCRRTGSAKATLVPTSDAVSCVPAGIVISASEPTAWLGSEIAPGSTAFAGRICLDSIASVIRSRGAMSCAAISTARCSPEGGRSDER